VGPPPPPPSSERIAFVLSGTIFLLEQGWIAQIENLRTGKIHFVREEEMIANIFNVKKIERNRVILGREGKKDIELKLGKR
jgi:type II secretory pathway component PulC